ncbi:MAG TPA: hypothetical protein VF070_40645 [Streptosporangiaceae bacterium]
MEISIAELEEVAARGWRGAEEEWLGGWLLRAGAGFAGRANSALACTCRWKTATRQPAPSTRASASPTTTATTTAWPPLTFPPAGARLNRRAGMDQLLMGIW